MYNYIIKQDLREMILFLNEESKMNTLDIIKLEKENNKWLLVYKKIPIKN